MTAPAAIAVFERAEPSFARARRASRARWSECYSEWDGALDGAPWRRSPSSCRRTGCSHRPRWRTTRNVRSSSCSARCCASAASRSPSGRCGSTAFVAATCSTGSSSASTASGRAPVRRRWRRTRSSGCARSPTEECDVSARARQTGYPVMWRPTGEEIQDDLQWLGVERGDPDPPLPSGPARRGSDHATRASRSARCRATSRSSRPRRRTLRLAGGSTGSNGTQRRRASG